jgi:hypothetical protein
MDFTNQPLEGSRNKRTFEARINPRKVFKLLKSLNVDKLK